MSYEIAMRDGSAQLIVTVDGQERCPYFDEHGHECINVASLCGPDVPLGHAASSYECREGVPMAWGRIRWSDETAERHEAISLGDALDEASTQY